MKLISRLAIFAGVALPLSLSAATISGTVTDRTTNKPAAGATAVLLDLHRHPQNPPPTEGAILHLEITPRGQQALPFIAAAGLIAAMAALVALVAARTTVRHDIT